MSTLTLCLLIWLFGSLPIAIAVGKLLASASEMYPEAVAIGHPCLAGAVPA
ncbi:hypothetical protein [Mesorhizobium sp.]|uniref:hypothetical protein n=1 Tax=Mesorhizobium sp. TaxID=1871066 RepID=UPI00257FCE4E|nr:hypothetical protein [Mesorhizobium sp.]